jgi:tetratricopeptide (TPR) repeat protein
MRLMDRTSRDGDGSEAPGLDETLPSGDHGPSPLRESSSRISTDSQGLDETLQSGAFERASAPSIDPGMSGDRYRIVAARTPTAMPRLSTEPQGLDETLQSDAFLRPSNPMLDETVLSAERNPGSSAPARPSHPPVERGTQIGRYTVIEPLGSGTMGLVVAAFDPTLDRKVAIKLVQLDPTGTTSGRQRLLREAQAMAKLQHPNVVTVFEVGTFEDRLFLAMEYVAGSTLADWLSQARSRREIVAKFVAAGHGLAAAHRASIVHRDFKPTNVLVGKDGRVRVADFGLATAPTEVEERPLTVSRESDPGPLGMTKTGAVLGTPAYMSPEQHRGQQADARADQFSFCVALYEALYKVLPFEGATFLVYQDNVLNGRMREAPRGSDVPSRIHRALVRGMAPSPGDRYPDMDALLVDLERDPAAVYRRAGLVGGAVLAAGTIAFFAARSTGDDDPCAASTQPLADVWTSAQRQAVEQSFTASGSPGAPQLFARVAKVLDDRAGALRKARREACVATAVRHEQSAELLDRRMQCIDQRAEATRALIGVMSEHHEAATLLKSVNAATSLPPLEPCADRASLMAEVPLPPPELRPQVEALAKRLDRIEAMEDAGLYPKAVEELEKVDAEADKLGHLPLAARAHFLTGDAHLQLLHNTQGVAELRKAAELAAGAHDDKLAAKAWVGLLGATGYRLGKYDEAKGIDPAAAAAVMRAGNPPGLAGSLENSRGLIELGRENYEGAAQHFFAAAHAQEKGDRSELSEVAHSYHNAGTALTWASKFDEARAAHEKALAHYQKCVAIDTKAYPPDSAQIAKDLVNIGLVYGELERHDEALANMQRALAIFEKHPEDNEQEMATVLYDLGLAYVSANKPKEAVATLEHALDVATKTHGAESDDVANILGGLLAVNDAAGDHAKAKEYGDRALAAKEKSFGKDHEQVGRTLGDLAQNANLRHAPKEALALIDRGLAIIEKPGAPDLAVRYEMRKIRANALLDLHRAADAAADAKLSRDGYIKFKEPTAAAAAQLVLADALWAQSGTAHKREAIAEAKAALDTVEAQPKPDAEVLANARTWLAKHAPP